MRSQLIAERAVSVRTLAQVASVDPDLAVAIDPVEVDEHQAVRVTVWQGEALAVPSRSSRQGTAAGRGGIVLAELAFDAPVVGQRE